jgi:hypothetical protein
MPRRLPLRNTSGPHERRSMAIRFATGWQIAEYVRQQNGMVE